MPHFVLAEALRESVLDRLLGGAALMTIPADWELDLYNGDPLDGGSVITGTGYARPTILAAGWQRAELGKANTGVIKFPPTGSGTGGWTFDAEEPVYLALTDGTDVLASVPGLFSDFPVDWVTTFPNYDRIEIPVRNLVLDMQFSPGEQAFAMSAGLRRSILDRLFGNVAWTPPSSWTLGLWNGSPFQGGKELDDPEYSRLTRANDGTEWEVAATGKTNLTEIRFPASGSPTRNWGYASHLCLCPAGGSPQIAMRLDHPVEMEIGKPLSLAAGSLEVDWIS